MKFEKLWCHLTSNDIISEINGVSMQIILSKIKIEKC